jgi:hypothetical protein
MTKTANPPTGPKPLDRETALVGLVLLGIRIRAELDNDGLDLDNGLLSEAAVVEYLFDQYWPQVSEGERAWMREWFEFPRGFDELVAEHEARVAGRRAEEIRGLTLGELRERVASAEVVP